MKYQKKILIIELKRIGDALLCAPLISALRKNFKNAKISLLCQPGSVNAVSLIKELDEILIYDKNWFYLPFLIKFLVQKFDFAFDCTGSQRSAFVSFLSFAQKRLTFLKTVKKNPLLKFCYSDYSTARVSYLHTIDYKLSLDRKSVV